MDIYHDALHQLVRPIKTPKTKSAIPGLRAAARLELAYSTTAHNEGVSEKERGLSLSRGDPLRDELLWDSKVAFDFEKIRKSRASRLTKIADKLAESKK